MSDLSPRESRQLNRKVASILHKGGSVGRHGHDSQILSQFCSQNALIKQFPESAFENFTKNMAIQTFIEDEVLFYQGQSISDDSYFYILLSGKLGVYINEEYTNDADDSESYVEFIRSQSSTSFNDNDPEGREEVYLGVMISSLIELSTFGENLVGHRRTASIKAVQSSTCIKIPLRVFNAMRTKYSDTIIINDYLSKILDAKAKDRKLSDVSYLADFLLQFRFFRSLPSNVRCDIAAVLSKQTCEPGDVLSTEGLEHDSIFIVMGGEIAVYSKEQQDSINFHRITQVNNHRELSENSYSTSSGSRDTSLSSASSDNDINDHVEMNSVEDATTATYEDSSKITEENLKLHDKTQNLRREKEEKYGKFITSLHVGDSYGHQIFAEVCGKHSVATVIAKEHSDILCIDHEEYQAIIKAYENDLQYSYGSSMRALRSHPRTRSSAQCALIEQFFASTPISDFFDQIPLILKEQMSECVRFKHIEKSKYVYKEDDAARNFFIIVSGTVKLQSNDSYETLIAGDTLGHKEILEGSNEKEDTTLRRRAHAIAIESCDLITLSKRYFYHILADFAEEERLIFNAASCRLNLMKPKEKMSNQKIKELAHYCRARLRFFSTLSNSAVENLISRSKYLIYKPFDPIICEGGVGGVSYVCIRGTAQVRVLGRQVVKMNFKKKQFSEQIMKKYYGVVVAKIGEGDSFGEQSSSQINKRGLYPMRNASIIATTNVHVIAVASSDYEKYVEYTEGTYGRLTSCLDILRKPPNARGHDDVKMLMKLASSNSFLRQLSDLQKIELCKSFQLRSASRGELICIQGDRAESMYVIMTGSVRVFVQSKAEGNVKLNKSSDQQTLAKRKYELADAFVHARRILKKNHRRSIYKRDNMGKQGQGRRRSLARSVLAKFRPKTVWDVSKLRSVFGKCVATLKCGDAFGELALQSDSKRSATCAAGSSGAELLLISKQDFERVLSKTNLEYQAHLLQEKMDVIYNMDSQTKGNIRSLVYSTMMQLDIFKRLPANIVKDLSAYFEYRNFKENTRIFDANDPSEYIYVIIHGVIELSSPETGSKIEKKSRGDIFGHYEIALKPIAVGIDVLRQFNCRSHSPVRLLAMKKTDFILHWKRQYTRICEIPLFVSKIYPRQVKEKKILKASDTSSGEIDIYEDRQFQSYLYDITILCVLMKKRHYTHGDILYKNQSGNATEFGMIWQGSCVIYHNINSIDTPCITLSRYGVYGLGDTGTETAVVTSPTFDTYILSNEELKKSAPKRVWTKIKYLSKYCFKTWRGHRNAEILHLSERLTEFQILNKAIRLSKKENKHNILKCGNIFGHPMRKAIKPSKNIDESSTFLNSPSAHSTKKFKKRATNFEDKSKTHNKNIVSFRKSSPGDPSNRRRTSVQLRRPFSSSGRRTEVLYGKWSVPNKISKRKESRPGSITKDKMNVATSFSRFARMSTMSKANVETRRPCTAIGVFKTKNMTTRTTKVDTRRQPARPKSVVASSRLLRNRKLVFRNEARTCNIQVSRVHEEHSDHVRRLNWLRCNRIQADKALAAYLA